MGKVNEVDRVHVVLLERLEALDHQDLMYVTFIFINVIFLATERLRISPISFMERNHRLVIFGGTLS